MWKSCLVVIRLWKSMYWSFGWWGLHAMPPRQPLVVMIGPLNKRDAFYPYRRVVISVSDAKSFISIQRVNVE